MCSLTNSKKDILVLMYSCPLAFFSKLYKGKGEDSVEGRDSDREGGYGG